MNGKPAVSIIVPVYNDERYIGDCLDSMKQQTLEDIEILCVDDGSTDDSLQRLREYAQKDPRIRVFSRDHAGAGAARNWGLSQVAGKYIMFCDSDDLYDRRMCETMVSAMTGSGPDLVKCGCVFFSPAEIRKEPLPKQGAEFHDTDFRWKGQIGRGVWDKIFKKEILDAQCVSFPPSSLGEDLSFLVQYSAVARNCRILPEWLYRYRSRQSSSMWRYENGIIDGSDDVFMSYRFTLQFLAARNAIMENGHLLFHLVQDILHLLKYQGRNSRVIFDRVQKEILSYYHADDLAGYPLLAAIAHDDRKDITEILDGLRAAQLMGIDLPPGARLVRVK